MENEDPYMIELNDATGDFLQDVEDLLDEINKEVMRAIYDAAVENRINKRIQESGISGYCSCCGAPHMVEDGFQDHDQECIWYEEKDNDLTTG